MPPVLKATIQSVGIHKASELFYNKQVQELDFTQASHIATLLKYPAPSTLSTIWQKKVIRRGNYAKYILQTKKNPSIKLIKNM